MFKRKGNAGETGVQDLFTLHFFARTLLECISLGDVKRARSTSFRELPVLKSEDPEIESRLRLLSIVRARPTPTITPGRQRLHLEAF